MLGLYYSFILFPSNLFKQLVPLMKFKPLKLESKKLRSLCILGGSGTIKPAGHLCLLFLLAGVWYVLNSPASSM
jgi:hypothetical protein